MSRSTVMLGFSVLPPLAKEVVQIAKEEHRTKSELFREMLRVYKSYRQKRRQEDEERWAALVVQEAIEEAKRNPLSPQDLIKEDEKLLEYGAKQAQKIGMHTDEDVMRIIEEYRAERRRNEGGS